MMTFDDDKKHNKVQERVLSHTYIIHILYTYDMIP